MPAPNSLPLFKIQAPKGSQNGRSSTNCFAFFKLTLFNQRHGPQVSQYPKNPLAEMENMADTPDTQYTAIAFYDARKDARMVRRSPYVLRVTRNIRQMNVNSKDNRIFQPTGWLSGYLPSANTNSSI